MGLEAGPGLTFVRAGGEFPFPQKSPDKTVRELDKGTAPFLGRMYRHSDAR